MAGANGKQEDGREEPSVQAREAQTVVVVAQRSAAVLALPLALLLFLALFLAYALWPGNLLYPPQATTLLRNEDAREFQRNHNQALENEIRTLQLALRGDVCTADAPAGSLLLPAAPPPLLPADQASAPGSPEPDADAEGETAAPQDRQPPASQPGQEPAGQNTRLSTSQLLARLDETTVFVVGSKGNGGVSTGSGILVTDRHVLTNLHVVDGVAAGSLRVANRYLSRPLSARVVGSSGTFDFSSSDFAVLELEEPVNVTPMALTGHSERLDPVVAAGFPAFVIQTDPEFVAAFEGGNLDRLNSVQMAVTEGVVTQKHPGAAGITVIGHTATTSPGNSGGPLVDRCGRVVGVNTFVRTDAENALRLNLALGAGDAASFLASNGVTALTADTACVEAAAPAIAQEAGTVPVQVPAEVPDQALDVPADPGPAIQIQPDEPPADPNPATVPQMPAPGRDADADLLRPLPEAGQ